MTDARPSLLSMGQDREHAATFRLPDDAGAALLRHVDQVERELSELNEGIDRLEVELEIRRFRRDSLLALRRFLYLKMCELEGVEPETETPDLLSRANQEAASQTPDAINSRTEDKLASLLQTPHKLKRTLNGSKTDRVVTAVEATLAKRGKLHRQELVAHLLEMKVLGTEANPAGNLSYILSNHQDRFERLGHGFWALRRTS